MTALFPYDERRIYGAIALNISDVLDCYGAVAGARDPAEIDAIIAELRRLNGPLWARIPGAQRSMVRALAVANDDR